MLNAGITLHRYLGGILLYKLVCLKRFTFFFTQEPLSSRKRSFAAMGSTRAWCPISSTSWTALKDATLSWTPNSTVASPRGSKNYEETTAGSAHFLNHPSSDPSPGTFRHHTPRYLSNRSEGQQEHYTSQLAPSPGHPKCPTLHPTWAG